MPRILLSTLFTTVLMFGFLGRAQADGRAKAAEITQANENARAAAAACQAQLSAVNSAFKQATEACNDARQGMDPRTCRQKAEECDYMAEDVQPLEVLEGLTGVSAGGSSGGCSQYTQSDFRSKMDELKSDIEDKTRERKDAQQQRRDDKRDFDEKISDINKQLEEIQKAAADREKEAKLSKIDGEQEATNALMEMKSQIRKLEQTIEQIVGERNKLLRQKEILLLEESNALLSLNCEDRVRKLGVRVTGKGSNLLARGLKETKSLKERYRLCLASLVKQRQGKSEELESRIAQAEISHRQSIQALEEMKQSVQQMQVASQQRQQIQDEALAQARQQDLQTQTRLQQEMLTTMQNMQAQTQEVAQSLATANMELTMLNNEMRLLGAQDPKGATKTPRAAIMAFSYYEQERSAFCQNPTCRSQAASLCNQSRTTPSRATGADSGGGSSD